MTMRRYRTRIKLYYHYFFLLIISWIALFLIVFLASLNLYRNQDKFLIRKVLYTTSNLRQYDDPDLYDFVSKRYLSGSYFDHKRFNPQYSTKIEKLKPSYFDVVVDTIVVKSFLKNTLVLDMKFVSPLLLVSYSGKYTALYPPNNIVPLYSWNTLGQNIPRFLFPQYLSGIGNLSWLLYVKTLEWLYEDVMSIYRLPLSGMVTYLPGGEKYIYRTDNRHIYFNAKKPLSWQIQQLYELIQHYPNFSSLVRIDIGSTEYPIVK